MDTGRRSALKAMGASGLALAVPNLGWAAVGQTQAGGQLPLYIITDHADAGGTFAAGALHACRQRGVGASYVSALAGGLHLDEIHKVDALLQGKQSVRLIGLVDEGTAAVVLSLARDAGARLYWLAQHQLRAGQARHAVQVATSNTCCEQLEPQLLAVPSSAAARKSWAAQLGYSLSRLHTRPASNTALTQLAMPQRVGSFVSFSLDTQGALHG